MIQQKERGYQLWLLGSDIVALISAYFGAILLRFYILGHLFARKGTPPLSEYLYTLFYVLVIWLVFFRFSGMYYPKLRGIREFFAVSRGVIFSILASMTAVFFFRPFHSQFTYSRAVLLIFALLVLVFVLVFRLLSRKLRYKILEKSKSLIRLVIVGRNKLGNRLAQEIERRHVGYEVVGFIDDNPASMPTSPTSVGGQETPIPLLGPINSLQNIIAEKGINEVWLALPNTPREKLMRLVEICLTTKVSWKMVPDFYEVMLDWVKIDSLDGIPLIGMKRSNITGFNALIKRVIDLVCATILLVLFGIPMLLITLLVKITSPGSVLYKQKRIGQDGKRFVFLKFRSMYPKVRPTAHKEYTEGWIKEEDKDKKQTVAAEPIPNAASQPPAPNDKKVYKMQKDQRITPMGRLLRKFSMDELPQLFNVFKGDMSLIGPRPPIAYEVDRYKEWHKRRLEARPGLTGLWQVSGRNLLSFEEMVKLDIYYIENWSIWMDLEILFKTIFVVIFGRAY